MRWMVAETGLLFSAQGDLRLMVPDGALIRVGNVRGDLLVKGRWGQRKSW